MHNCHTQLEARGKLQTLQVLYATIALCQEEAPVKVGAHIPEEIEGQLACLLLAVELIALLGFPQLVCKAVAQLVLPHVLL